MNFQYKTLVNVDLFSIAELEKNCFDEQLRWSENMLKDSVESPVTKFFGAFAEICNQNCRDLQLVGYCAIVDYGIELELLRICVFPNFQQNGVGGGLLNFVINTLKNNQNDSDAGRAIILEVSKDNVIAKKLYEKYGFKQLSVRKNYYFEKGKYSDAIIMRLFL